MKRLFDVVFSCVVLLVLFPVGIILSLLIVIESRGGAFFKQERVGRYGKPFFIYKFRSMRLGAEKQGKLTIGVRDQRITRVGYFLRKFKLDEFPQFYNVLKGDMSIVGPRPEVKEYVAQYTSDQLTVLNVKPGITDYASLAFFKENELLAKSENPNKTYLEEIMPAKLALNKKYLLHRTFGQDMKIIWQTLRKILGKK